MVSAAPARLRDPTFYPVEEKVGEDSLQTFIAELFRTLVEHHLALRGTPTFVGADQFIYWAERRPQKVVAPDVYVLPGMAPGARVPCLKTWEAGLIPSFALEIVSPNAMEKDYVDAPPLYDELGVDELLIFDPDHRRSRARFSFQVHRRVRGAFTRVTATREDRVRSRVLGCWIRAVGQGDLVRLRLAGGARGEALIPTEAELERAQATQERAQATQERARAEQAEAEVARLRAELDRLRKKPRDRG